MGTCLSHGVGSEPTMADYKLRKRRPGRTGEYGSYQQVWTHTHIYIQELLSTRTKPFVVVPFTPWRGKKDGTNQPRVYVTVHPSFHATTK